MCTAAERRHLAHLGLNPDSLGVQRAVEICRGCPVRVPCLEHALENGISIGIWGGESERSRRRIRAARRREARSAR